MAAVGCSRCLLLRPSIALPIRRIEARATPVLSRAPFSSSAPTAAATVLKAAAGSSRQGHIVKAPRKKNYKKKGAALVRHKAPAPGERKAFRKRIQLSNNNALPVPGLLALSKENMADPESSGQIFSVPDVVVDQLRSVEAFKPTQTWGLFRQPSTLVRSDTVRLAEKLESAVEAKEALRLVVYGDRIAGKSMMLLQAMAHGFMNGWVVINIPEAQELTTACTEYARLADSEPAQYTQPTYLMKLLSNIRKANDGVLSNLKIARAYPELPVRIPQDASLSQLAAAAKEAEHAWPVFQVLWAELTNPDVPRPPLMFALDGLGHVMKTSDYRSPAFELIHSHDLSLVRLYTDALAGTLALPHGGAVLAATSRGNAERNASLELALAQRQAEQDKKPVPPTDPFCRRYDARVDAVLRTVQVLKLSGVSKTEARSLMEYWAASGVLRAKVDERTVVDRWSLGGHGIVGEMERATLLNMRL